MKDQLFREHLLDLIQSAWKERRVPQQWVDAILVPVPKKGELSLCDNWRGISLLDVVGKVAAKVVQGRLQDLVERVMPESQCGFRKGRGCTDMIYTVRQLVEKSWEHQSKIWFVFIDLKKAYDSVPREALWMALEKLGVPDSMIDLVRSFHQGMKAKIRLEDEEVEEIEVNNGLRQGCCMAPALFNLYSCLLVDQWAARMRDVEDAGVFLRHKEDGKLFRRYTRNAEVSQLSECQFADDVALLATSRAGAERALTEYIRTARDFGLTVNLNKTKIMVTGREATDGEKVACHLGDGGVVEYVNEFPYLGSMVADSGRVSSDVDRRITQASKAFGTLRRAVFADRDLTAETKRKIYVACVLSVLLYGSECWTPLRKDKKKLNAFHHRCIRSILGITNKQQWDQHITSFEVRQRWGDITTAVEMVARRRLEWLGHLARMTTTRTPRKCLFGWLPQPRPRGGPRKRWRDVVRCDLREREIDENEWMELATESRRGWRAAYREVVSERTTTQYQDTTQTTQESHVLCETCGRTFRRESDKKRHKCITERQKPIHEQHGAVHCTSCDRWFRSRGGFTVHTCRTQPES